MTRVMTRAKTAVAVVAVILLWGIAGTTYAGGFKRVLTNLAAEYQRQQRERLQRRVSFVGTAFYVGEVETGGLTKQCVYDYLGSYYVLTVSSVQLCPLTAQVR